MMEDIFYPNNLSIEDVDKLSGWKLKIAVLHFGIGRKDCIRFGYGYKFIKSNIFAEKPTIHFVADRDGEQRPIDLESEIDWDSPVDLLAECGIKISDIYKQRIKSQLEEMKD